MSLLVVVTSHRVAPGLLSWRAWTALRSGTVWTGAPDHPQLPFLAEAGIDVEVVMPDPRRILEVAAAQDIVWLAGADGDEDLLRRLGEMAVQAPDPPSIEVVPGSYDLPGGRLLDVVAVMDRLRLDCPWTARKTHESLAHFLIEEAYEAIEAIETGDFAAVREELGDVLLQVVFHARIAEESGNFGIDDVAGELTDKLVRRHPHVFASTEVTGPDEVKGNWEQIKAAEKAAKAGGRSSALDGVPLAQPALALAHAVQRRAEQAGFPVDADEGPGLGAELFNLVRRARAEGVDPEAALRAAVREFRARVEAWETPPPPA